MQFLHTRAVSHLCLIHQKKNSGLSQVTPNRMEGACDYEFGGGLPLGRGD